LTNIINHECPVQIHNYISYPREIAMYYRVSERLDWLIINIMIIDVNTTHDEIGQQQSRKAVLNKCHEVDHHTGHSVMTHNVKSITEGERSSLALEIET
jgi:hypothetical protein